MVARENARRRDVHYKPGDLVLLSTKNLMLSGPGTKKLKPSYVGPFEVDRMIGQVAVRLHLPDTWTRIHNVFHVNLVKPYLASPEDHEETTQRKKDKKERKKERKRLQECAQPPLQYLDGEPLFEVEEIRDHEIIKKGRGWSYSFFIKWKGYSEDNNSWEPERNLLTCDEMLRQYKAQNGLPWHARDLME